MRLPLDFLNKMKGLLGEEEYERFLSSYDMQRYYGLRVNTLKAAVEEFLEITPFALESIPWTKDGFYYREGEAPGRHPYYYAGLYYIQEPSAMLPGAVLDAKPGENILDLCAAPGGKTVQIAAGMKGEGLLVANDISSERVKALVKNIELLGIRNAMVTNDTPAKLAVNFAGFFDRILIDAPCSGEGMFRKDEEAARSWERFKCEKCAGMQENILESVDTMLKAGGTIVYSTCTFSPEEDEQMISKFLQRHGNYEILEVPKTAGIDDGRPMWSDGNPELSKTARLWPHKIKGEGHFVALLRKMEEDGKGYGRENGKTPLYEAPGARRGHKSSRTGAKEVPPHKNILGAFKSFQENNLNITIDGNFIEKGDNLYCLPVEAPDLSGIKVAKFGWYLGGLAWSRFEPSHSLVLSLKKAEIKRTMDFPSASKEVLSYLKGETLLLEGEKGLVGVCVDGYTLGWAKQTGDMLKNLYPKGWRKMA